MEDEQSESSMSVEFALDTWMLLAQSTHGQLNECDQTEDVCVEGVWGRGITCRDDRMPLVSQPVRGERLHSRGNISSSQCAGERTFFMNKTCCETASRYLEM